MILNDHILIQPAIHIHVFATYIPNKNILPSGNLT